MQILVAIAFFLIGAQLLGGKTRVFKLPIEFGEYAQVAGWLFLLLGIALVVSALRSGKRGSGAQT